MKHLLAIGGIIALFFILTGCNRNIGSVVPTGEYHYDVITYSGTKTQVLKTTPGTLGSVVITGSPAEPFHIYDATTTSVLLRGNTATTALPLIASFPASVAAGTYTFDASSLYGLMSVFDGTIATATITWR